MKRRRRRRSRMRRRRGGQYAREGWSKTTKWAQSCHVVFGWNIYYMSILPNPSIMIHDEDKSVLLCDQCGKGRWTKNTK